MTAPVRYRPSNSEESYWFITNWCCLCLHDGPARLNADTFDGCEILARALVLEINDPAYPVEWCEGGPGGACCTAFHGWNESDPRNPPADLRAPL